MICNLGSARYIGKLHRPFGCAFYITNWLPFWSFVWQWGLGNQPIMHKPVVLDIGGRRDGQPAQWPTQNLSEIEPRGMWVPGAYLNPSMWRAWKCVARTSYSSFGFLNLEELYGMGLSYVWIEFGGDSQVVPGVYSKFALTANVLLTICPFSRSIAIGTFRRISSSNSSTLYVE